MAAGRGGVGPGSALAEARRQFQSSDLVRDGMRRLADRSGETVLFAVGDADDGMLTYVDIIESRNSVRFAAAIGDRRPLYSTAGGRALAALPETVLRAYLDRIGRNGRPARPRPTTALTAPSPRRAASGWRRPSIRRATG